MDSPYVILSIIVIIIAIVISAWTSGANEKRKVHKNNVYKYTAKTLIMSKSEADFFRKLSFVAQDRYYVFPQIHLSAILDHRVKGQDWKIAFRHINGKSVDYVLCDKETLRPAYAVELDDATHQQRDRIERDREVERIFEQAGIPLVRFSSKDTSESEIVEAFAAAKTQMKAQTL